MASAEASPLPSLAPSQGSPNPVTDWPKGMKVQPITSNLKYSEKPLQPFSGSVSHLRFSLFPVLLPFCPPHERWSHECFLINILQALSWSQLPTGPNLQQPGYPASQDADAQPAPLLATYLLPL